jgi:enoyl-CoA hydratase
MQMWEDLHHAWDIMGGNGHAKVVILSGAGNNFSTGMDLSVFIDFQALLSKESCEGRKREAIGHFIDYLQDAISGAENCPVPVIAAIHGQCIGGAIDLICAADLRYCTKDAVFCIKETDLAIVADIGTLQRLPKLIGTQKTAELTYTGRNFSGVEAEALGLVAKSFDTVQEMNAYVEKVASEIAQKSPLTIRLVIISQYRSGLSYLFSLFCDH